MNAHDIDDLELRIDDESICMSFENAWKTSLEPALNEFLPPPTNTRFRIILTELIKIDCEHRLRHDLPQQNYFNDLCVNSLADAQLNVISNELLYFELELRRKLGKPIDTDDVLARLMAGTRSNAQEIVLDFKRQIDTVGSDSTRQPTEKSLRSQSLSPVLNSGDQLDHYQLQEIIGRGSFATVFAALDTQLMRKVAIKVFQGRLTEGSVQKQRIWREAHVAASLNHDNIVPVYGTGMVNEIHYIVYRFVAGGTLEQLIASRQLLLRESVAICEKIAAALCVAHENGIVHRDLKPANIMIENGQPKVIDFGLAHVVDTLSTITFEGDILGTPLYMSPEQATGGGYQADPRSDIYSLGVILYQLVCHQLPFQGSTTEVIGNLINFRPTPPSKINPQINRDLQTIILRCLEKNPEDRYLSAAFLRSDLILWQAGRPIKARPVGPLTRGLKWSVNNPITTLFITVVVAMGLFLSGALTQLGVARGQRDRAVIAEKITEELYAQTAADAGLLALNRGQFELARQHFQSALERSSKPEVKIQIGLVLCHLGLRNLKDAVSAFQLIDVNCSAPEYFLLQADLALEGFLKHQNVESLVERSLQTSTPLSVADQHYARGIIALNSTEAIQHFHQAVQLEAHHHRAIRMLVIAQFSMAQFESLNRQLQTARQLFPEDDDFVLLDALRLAACGSLEQANEVTRGVPMSPDELKRWLRFNEFVWQVAHEMPFDSGLAEFNSQKLVHLSETFTREIQPLLKKRGWRFPPKIASLFQSLPKQILNHDLENSTAAIASLEQLVSSHPEAALTNLLAGFHIKASYAADLERDKMIEHLCQANDLFLQATESPSFLNGGTHFAWKGVFATSAALAVTVEYETKSYQTQLASAAEKISCDEVAPRHLATFSMLLMKFGHAQIADRWIQAWINHETSIGTSRLNALWYQARCQNDLNRWPETLEALKQIFEIDPNHSDAQQLREQLVNKINVTLNLK